MTWFWFGFAAGILLTIPLAAIASRRTAGRVRRLEKQAQSAQRLAELGTLTGGLAHEIKNPLSTIGLNVQLIEEDLGELAELHRGEGESPGSDSVGRLARIERRFEALARETKRLRDILDDFLRFAGRVKLDRVETDINALVGELADFFAPQAAAADIQLRTQFAAHPVTVLADPSLLKQALLNLMINATQAMSHTRREADRSTGHGGSDELMIRTDWQRRQGEEDVVVHVIDTGAGLQEATSEQIFQPYFSTKSGGTGLGLPTARRIVEEHGGSIHVHSEEGRGCDFEVRLPVR